MSPDKIYKIQSHFSDLIFEEKSHTYHVGNTRYPSVSSLVESHAFKFNEDKMLPFSAKKASRLEGRVVTPDELRVRWRTTNKMACDLGTKTHKFLEDYTGLETPTSPQEEAGVKYLRSLVGEYNIAFKELRVYSKIYGYAGTMDLPLEVIGQYNTYVIDDYKTNGDLFKAYDNLKEPFSHLEASPFNKYQIQLSYYQIPLQDIGLNIKNRRIIHLKKDSTYQIFDTYDFSDALRDYMKFLNKKVA